jgi:apolipoprotein N-acyltransferase
VEVDRLIDQLLLIVAIIKHRLILIEYVVSVLLVIGRRCKAILMLRCLRLLRHHLLLHALAQVHHYATLGGASSILSVLVVVRHTPGSLWPMMIMMFVAIVVLILLLPIMIIFLAHVAIIGKGMIWLMSELKVASITCWETLRLHTLKHRMRVEGGCWG